MTSFRPCLTESTTSQSGLSFETEVAGMERSADCYFKLGRLPWFTFAGANKAAEICRKFCAWGTGGAVWGGVGVNSLFGFGDCALLLWQHWRTEWADRGSNQDNGLTGICWNFLPFSFLGDLILKFWRDVAQPWCIFCHAVVAIKCRPGESWQSCDERSGRSIRTEVTQTTEQDIR